MFHKLYRVIQHYTIRYNSYGNLGIKEFKNTNFHNKREFRDERFFVYKCFEKRNSYFDRVMNLSNEMDTLKSDWLVYIQVGYIYRRRISFIMTWDLQFKLCFYWGWNNNELLETSHINSGCTDCYNTHTLPTYTLSTRTSVIQEVHRNLIFANRIHLYSKQWSTSFNRKNWISFCNIFQNYFH